MLACGLHSHNGIKEQGDEKIILEGLKLSN